MIIGNREMKTIIDILDGRITGAMNKSVGRGDCVALLRATTDAKFGDYQANGVMALARKLKTNPRELAAQVVANLEIEDICEPAEVAGPGFINLRLRSDFLAEKLLEINADRDRLAIDRVDSAETVVVDFSAPNIAKQMHVGHLRSTIIGDCICRMLEFQGHTVIRQNHIGDWGSQFGMLIAYLKQENPEIIENPDMVHIADLEDFYKRAKARYDADETFAEQARREVVNLHGSQADTLRIWRHIVDESRDHYQPVYDVLDVTLKPQHERGESAYNDMLGGVVADLNRAGLARESKGAMCVFPEGFSNKQGEPLPFIIRKTDGAYLYATTDLAAIRYRVDELKADRIVYVTDARQGLHFQMLFATVRSAGWVGDDVELAHVTFGTMLGADGRPFKTRTGGTVKLRDLLDEAVQRARVVVEQKNPEFDETIKQQIARAVGIGAVKYADYSNNRNSDFIFSFDKMLAMEGNTAPYMQYAYARVKSIERKAGDRGVDVERELADIGRPNLTDPAETDLARHLLRYGEAIKSAAAEYRPNYLTTYLYGLAGVFSGFYNACPVLDADGGKRPTRLLLCDLTARTIRHGLSELLGINVVEQM